MVKKMKFFNKSPETGPNHGKDLEGSYHLPGKLPEQRALARVYACFISIGCGHTGFRV